jgi:predicted NBD/HSP70 family sugar kinase
VNEVVEHLLNAGYLSERPTETGQTNKPGRRPRLFEFRTEIGYVLGVDIGANKTLAAVADLGGNVLSIQRRATTPTSAEEILARTRALVADVLREGRVRHTSLVAAAVGTPGVVDTLTGRIRLAPQLPGWDGLDLRAAMQAELSCPVLVDNEVRLAVLAERWRGAARNSAETLLVHVGFGIGAGILIGGEIYRGATSAAGEIGSLLISEKALPAAGLGQFEFEAGGMAYERLGREAALEPDAQILRELVSDDVSGIDASVIFEAAHMGCPAARRVLDTLIGRLARGVASAVMLLDPALVVIGGGISRAGRRLLDPLETSIRSLIPTPPPIVLSTLGDEAVALGALRLALEEADQRLLNLTPTSGLSSVRTPLEQGAAPWL